MFDPRSPMALLSACVLAFTLGAVGCTPSYVRGTNIAYTSEKQALADVVERYRQAVESRDAATLQALASNDYYENASTTTDPSDDYGTQGLAQVLTDLRNAVKEVRYDVDIKSIETLGETATVDYEYRGQYLFTVGERDRWETVSDQNRLTLRKEAGQWRILSGM
ncbi:MAG: nuclear transport factor 2 family protein [Myxococcales bacterium]|nr:nuclear transport factor 2 family protein [Myxococcales bacterium]